MCIACAVLFVFGQERESDEVDQDLQFGVCRSVALRDDTWHKDAWYTRRPGKPHVSELIINTAVFLFWDGSK